MGVLTKICPNGHKMAKTRRRKPTGKTYCVECKVLQVKRWRRENCGTKRYSINLRKARLKRVYGITMEYFDALFKKQGSGCDICKRKEPKGPNWSIDHCHKTGKIRGILCVPCNLGIGQLQESKKVLKSAIKYLEN